MLNREYQKRAARQGPTPIAPGAVSNDAGVNRLPWAGIFEPWRPFVLIAAAVEQETAKRAEKPVLSKSAAKRCKKSTRQLQLFDGKLRGVQLSLFDDKPAAFDKTAAPENASFPPLAGMIDPLAPEIATEDELAAEFEKLKLETSSS